jgi:hypothetical protein
LGALAVSLTEATGISRKEAMEMPYEDFLITYLDAAQVAKERERRQKRRT